MVLAEAVTEAEAVEDALSEGGEGDTGSVSDLANTVMPLIPSSA
jgi:hypothetical protein